MSEDRARDPAEPAGTPEGGPADERVPHESRRRGFVPDEPEYDDEPPGALLRERRLGSGAVVWGWIALALVLGLGATGWAASAGWLELGAGSRLPLEVLWNLVPVAATAGLLVSLFVRANAGDRDGVRTASVAAALQLAAVSVWIVVRFAVGIVFLEES